MELRQQPERLETGVDIDVRDPRIRCLLQFLHSSQTDLAHLRVDVLAEDLNLSVSRFRHLFQRETGHAPGRYIKLIRLRRAKYLLQSCLQSVKQAGAAVGVADISHFVRDYKSLHGETPKQTVLDVWTNGAAGNNGHSKFRQ